MSDSLGNKKRGRSGSTDSDGSPLKSAKHDKKSSPAPPTIDLAAISALQASVAAQLASVSGKVTTSAPKTASAAPAAASHILRLDTKGREIDADGNVITVSKPTHRSVANRRAAKKSSNPYLAHQKTSTKGDNDDDDGVFDDRIIVNSRNAHAQRALQFYDAGSIIQAEEDTKKRILARQGVGRHHPEMLEKGDGNGDAGVDDEILPPMDGGIVPSLEWWDVEFLPIEYRKDLGLMKKQGEQPLPTADLTVDSQKLALQNCKTYKLIQHPPGVKSLKPEAEEKPLEVMLTKKERKKIRTQRRMGVEQERRDKQMMGLIPVPEPKFKLSNFMKILGDQAIADPSAVEKKVIEQMRKRELKAEMDNLARKLTPEQKYEKKVRKIKEASIKAREIHVAVFAVNDLDAPKQRYKVDINAQSWLLTGTVLLCQQGRVNLVLVEGGPRAIKKFTRLMMNRIQWDCVLSDEERIQLREREKSGSSSSAIDIIKGEGVSLDLTKDGNADAMDVGDIVSDDDDDGDGNNTGDYGNGPEDGHYTSSGITNTCHLVWSGVNAERVFPNFKFRECKTQIGAKKLLEGNFLHPYWEMAIQEEKMRR